MASGCSVIQSSVSSGFSENSRGTGPAHMFPLNRFVEIGNRARITTAVLSILHAWRNISKIGMWCSCVRTHNPEYPF